MKLLTFNSQAEVTEHRKTGLGASEAAAVMGCSKFQTRSELWARKTGRMLPQPSNPAMRRGLSLEPLARAEYIKITGYPVAPAFAQHAKFPFILASLDGLCLKNGKAVEIKCPGKVDHATACRGRVPDHYVWQLVQTLLVTDLPRIDYWSFDGQKGKLLTFERSSQLETALLKELKVFWHLVTYDIEPEAPKTASNAPWTFPVRKNRGKADTFKSRPFQEKLAAVIEMRKTK